MAGKVIRKQHVLEIDFDDYFRNAILENPLRCDSCNTPFQKDTKGKYRIKLYVYNSSGSHDAICDNCYEKSKGLKKLSFFTKQNVSLEELLRAYTSFCGIEKMNKLDIHKVLGIHGKLDGTDMLLWKQD